MSAHESTEALRLRRCVNATCNALFTICARCDRGQRYCSEECRRRKRREQLLAAGSRYQASDRGKQAHSRRQRAYRCRQRRHAVTHQGGVSITTSDPPQTPTLNHCLICGLRSRWINPFDMYKLPRSRRPRRRIHTLATNVQISTFSDDR